MLVLLCFLRLEQVAKHLFEVTRRRFRGPVRKLGLEPRWDVSENVVEEDGRGFACDTVDLQETAVRLALVLRAVLLVHVHRLE